MAKSASKASWLQHWPRALLALPFIAALWVPSYNRIDPALGGIPFFYWYQLAWILIGAAIVLIVYGIETKITRVTGTAEPPLDADGTPGDIL
jgi:Protein of unknown function (DUF3311)